MSEINELCHEISNIVKEKTYGVLKNLCEIWQHSYKEETIISHCKKFTDHVDDLYSDIIEEAEAVREAYVLDLEKLMKEMSEICKLLSEPLPKETFEDLVLFDAIVLFKEKLQSFRKIHQERKDIVDSLLSKENSLCNELGVKPKGLTISPLPSSKDLKKFEDYLYNLQNEIQLRKADLETLRIDFLRIFDELEIRPSLDFEVALLNGSEMKVSDNIMSHVRKSHAEYLEKLERSKEIVLELRERLSHLWERLEEDINVRQEFLHKYPGHGNKTALALREEIKKCEERKRNNIKVFIEKLREEINIWWDKCMISQDERSKFTAYRSDFYSEDLLTLHELLAEQLEHFYLNNQKIFDLLSKRYDLWEKLTELESKSNDANRYNNRGGKLLQEEKERKKIALQLPRVEEELLSLCNEYEIKTGKSFTAFGEDIETIIKNKHMERKIDKECQLSARKQARAVTPGASSTRTRLFTSTKSSTNIISTPTPAKLRRRSPVFTPKIPSARKAKVGSGNIFSSNEQTPKTSANVLSIKKKGSIVKRRSGPTKSESKMKKTLASLPPEELLNTSKTYAQFKTHLAKNSHLRSSIAPNRACPKIIISENTPPPSTSRVTRQNTFSGLEQRKTPRLTRSSSVLSPATLNNKLSTKNLPIII